VTKFTKLINTQIDIDTNKQMLFATASMRTHQQLIPNVKRIKLEKMRALRRKKAKDELHGKRKRRGIFDLSDETDQHLKEQA